MTRCVTRGSVVFSGLKFWSTTRLNGLPCLTRSCRKPMRRPAGGTRNIAALCPGSCHASRSLKTMAPSTSGFIVSLRRLSNFPTLTLDYLRALLREYVGETEQLVDLVLIDGVAMLAYGHPSRATIDVDGELRAGVRSLKTFLSRHNIPANLGQSLSGWSVVAMPPGYRDRVTALIDEPGLRLSLLAPVDFIVSELRRGTDEDLTDATWIAERFHVTSSQVRAAAEAALAASLEDTALFLFERTVDRFCQAMG